jgi:hypothetical protein
MGTRCSWLSSAGESVCWRAFWITIAFALAWNAAAQQVSPASRASAVKISSAPAAASLIPSSDGTIVYDSVNGIGWLANANTPANNRFGLPLCSAAGASADSCVNASGTMNYNAAVAWVGAMNAANYLGHGDWQLPTTPTLDPGCSAKGPNGNNFGFGCSASALGALFYQGLGIVSPNAAILNGGR